MRFTAAALLLAASPALARTDLEGCTYSDSVVNPDHGGAYATRIWYVPDTGEICAFLDCGGGRAPPKTTVPGCPQYDGTATYSPSYLDGYATSTEAAAAETSTEETSATITEAPTTAAETTVVKKTTLSTSVSEVDDEDETTSSTPGSASATPSGSGGSNGSNGSNSTAGKTPTASESAETAAASTGGAASMPTAGAILGLVAGAAVYAGMF